MHRVNPRCPILYQIHPYLEMFIQSLQCPGRWVRPQPHPTTPESAPATPPVTVGKGLGSSSLRGTVMSCLLVLKEEKSI
ncbi:hypothetical protein EV1_013212 [Malus domestica]